MQQTIHNLLSLASQPSANNRADLMPAASQNQSGYKPAAATKATMSKDAINSNPGSAALANQAHLSMQHYAQPFAAHQNAHDHGDWEHQPGAQQSYKSPPMPNGRQAQLNMTIPGLDMCQQCIIHEA